jgi:hypothetical protein
VRDKACMDDFERVQDASAGTISHRFHEDTVAVVIVNDKNVIVAGTGSDDESARLIGMNLTDGGFTHGSVAMVRAMIVGIAGGKLKLPSSSISSRGVVWGEGVVGGCVLVDRTFFRAWSRCPLIIGTDTGGYVDNVLVVRPGNSGKYPRSSAVLSVVDNTGKKRVACANATRSAGEVDVMAAKLTCGVVLSVVGGGVETIRRCHRPVSGDQSPC